MAGALRRSVECADRCGQWLAGGVACRQLLLRSTRTVSILVIAGHGSTCKELSAGHSDDSHSPPAD